jgi:hypothetical protein
MPRKPVPSIPREVVPIATPAPQAKCDGFCMMDCERCWGDVLASGWVLATTPLLLADLDDATYAALNAAAAKRGMSIEDVAAEVLRQWAGRKG